ncbi:GrpB family protein [Arthrobacter echini]|uniref:GrpB family protein n=1 Tax=Arthrobacter echini TaxID=1529066 RepID=A0A4S5E2X5_9MICC|nr:GrpB family protein [Arthrobacter echini]THJ65758.1 GrpB family protein [Arthrobacter echini]
MNDRYSSGIRVVAHSPEWARQFEVVAGELAAILAGVPVDAIEHVGSTSVAGLPAKPLLDVDVVVQRRHIANAIRALELGGYVHCGDLGLADREALTAPDERPSRSVYLCVADTLHLRNHLAVRDVLRARSDLHDRYGAVKQHLAREPGMTIDRYIAGKSAVLQEILAASTLTEEERRLILEVNVGP